MSTGLIFVIHVIPVTNFLCVKTFPYMDHHHFETRFDHIKNNLGKVDA